VAKTNSINMSKSTLLKARKFSLCQGIFATFLALVISALSISAQLSLTNGSPSGNINFSNSMQTSVGSNPSTVFTGAGFDANPTTSGRLNSNAWAVTGWTDGPLAFGGTRITASTDYTRGAQAAAVTTGGMYAYTGAPVSGVNPMLMIAPGGADWAPGTLALRIQNNGTTNITELSVSYNMYIRNDQARSNSFNFSHSADNATYTDVAALDYNSPAAIGVTTFELVGTAPSRSTTITGLSIIPGGFYFIRWSGADVGGSGSRDEFGLDDIQVNATFAAGAGPTKLAVINVTPASPSANASFSATVQSQNASSNPANVTANTDVVLSITTGTGTLSGTLTGTILAGTNSVVLSGLSYNVAESGVVTTATRTAGDVLTAGNSAGITFQETATNLTISAVNGGLDPLAYAPFNVTVTSRNSLNVTAPVLANTNVVISLGVGTGAVGGTLAGTILAGQSSVTLSGITYSQAENGVSLNVARTSGDVLTSGSSAAFNVQFGLTVGDVSILAYEFNDPDKFAFVTWVNIPNGFRIKFTDNAFLSSGSANAASNARGGETFVIWQNNTGNLIPAGTVIEIQQLVASTGAASAGSTTGIATNALSTSGDQIFAYFGTATSGTNPDWASNSNPTTFNGILIHGINVGTASWLTTGTVTTNLSYLPSELNVTNGNIAIVNATFPRGGQYTGTRNGFASFADYKNAVNNTANWTYNTTIAPGTLNLTPFVINTNPPTKLAIVVVNGGLNPSANVPFTIEINALNAADELTPVGINTTVLVSVFTGTGTLAGTLTGTITAGNGQIFLSGLTYNILENAVLLRVERTSGDVLAAGFSPVFDVIGNAETLVFVTIPTLLYFQNNIPTFTVEARRSDNSIDLQYNGMVTLSMSSGLGTITGTLTQIAINGIATFGGLQFSSIGTKVLQASSGSLTPGFSPTLTVSFTDFTEIIFPQFMQGANGTNNNRIPVAFRANLQGLIPNATYRYFNLAVDAGDNGFTNGAGIPIFPNASGYTRAATPSFSSLGSYGEFTTNSGGAYTGWFMLEPTANDRFTPGNEVNMRIMLNDGANGTSTALRLTSAQTLTVLNFTGAEQGTALRGTSFATDRNFVAAYDNVAGSGRPISVTVAESDLLIAQPSYAAFYTASVNNVSGAWGMIIPNNLPNGIRRLDQRRLDNGERIDCGNRDEDGVWPSGGNTVNPSSGATAIHITNTDAPLRTSQAATSISATYTTICPGNSVTLSVVGGSLHQGGIWRWFNAGCGTGSFSTGPSVNVSPSVTTTYYVRGETACFQTTCATITIVVGACPSNDLQDFAPSIASNNFNICFPSNGDVSTANPSVEANSPAVTGEDVWYRFTANSPGARIFVNTASFDAIIELQDALGNTLATENAVTGIGSEILNYYSVGTPLVVGQEYFIGVRNNNSSLGTGSFSICVQKIRATSCNSTGPYAMCGTFKATSVGANAYTFTFTNTTTLAQTILNTSGGITVVPLGSLLPGFDYTVTLVATYNLLDGNGGSEVITITTTNACTITLAPHTNIELRVQDRCTAGPRPANAIVGANTWLCGSQYYQWRFRQTAPSLDVAFGSPINGTPTNRFLALSAAGLTAGATYDVEIRPVFAGAVFGTWSTTARCLQIIGSAMILEEETQEVTYRSSEESNDNAPSMKVYPNPTTGERITARVNGISTATVMVRVLDAVGREVYATQWSVDGETQRELVFSNPLAPGMYVVEMRAGDVRVTERIMVQR